MSSRHLGSALVGVGIFGLVAAATILVVGWTLVGTATENFAAVLVLTDETLGSAEATLAVAEAVLDSAEEGLQTAAALAGDASETLTRVAAVTETVDELVTEQVPDAIESVRSALRPLASTAAVVDGVMRALTLVGVDYDPQVPLGEAIEGLERELADIAPLLRSQSEPLAALGQDLGSFAGQADSVASQLEALTESIDETRVLIAAYDESLAEAQELVEEAAADLTSQRRLARAAVVALALALAASQAATLAFGWWLRRPSENGAAVAEAPS